ncbi:hypothetical protein MM_3369 [Methanosarcina mazei Go1]|uniref:Uncharacterized protein n=1 Tax=Methanosarcina mazei (strain ATCC BAA-159 / DSM 3647 / Goe1 / Go1 / JCM 11833 / OCM 88) TaxID=192952 RepID=Q8PRS4_METMA|nr:hypothetical protein MM_3369 [Methanosarcina mazei Go1]
MDLAHESNNAQAQPPETSVSILVLVDLAHESKLPFDMILSMSGFNPCFSGSCSRIRG